MSEPIHCPDCGAELAPGQPMSLCPRCGLMGALKLGDAATTLTPALSHQMGEGARRASECMAGRSFGDYELLEEIARGGMGIVYRARQKSLDRIVAVKLLLFGSHADDDLVRRFKVEATAAGSLHHPNIVAIHEVGLHDGQHFLAMDFVDGPNLAKLVRDQPLPAKRAAAYVRTIADAIHSAHEKNVLHRDLKPSNVLVDASDQPRLTDFGLARRLDGDSSLTLSGQVLGSPNYMPPEQAAAIHDKVSRRSDVYGLGAILYHLLTGRPPFQGATIADTVHQVVNNEPASPRVVNPDVPLDLETICLKCLEKEPARRYATALELSGELRRVAHGEPILARPVGGGEKLWRWCRRKPALAALGLIVLALLVTVAVVSTGAAWRINLARNAERHERQRAETNALAEARERRHAEDTLQELELQRVESLLAVDKASEALAHLGWVLRHDTSNRVAAARLMSVLSQRSFAAPVSPPLIHAGRVMWANFSPDGQRVASASADGTARVWDARTGQPVTMPLKHDGEVRSVSFSPDGGRVVTASADKTARIWDVSSGQELKPPLVHDAGVLGAEFSANGKFIATFAGRTACIWDAAITQPVTVPLKHGSDLRFARFSRDGLRLVTSAQDSIARVWDAQNGQQLAALSHPQAVRFADFNPDGNEVLTACYDGGVRVWDLSTGVARLEMRHQAVAECAVFSPDGQLIASASWDRTVRVWNARTGAAWVAPLPHSTWVIRVAFSGDGQRLVATCQDNTAWIWDARTGELLCELLRHDGPVNVAMFSPDGRRVVTASDDKSAQVWDVRRGAQSAQRLTHAAGVTAASFSADGTRVVTAAWDRTARVWDARTGEPLTEPLRHPNNLSWGEFDPTGQRVLTSCWDGTATVWNVNTGQSLFPPVKAGPRLDYAEFSPDGTRFVTASRNGSARVWNSATGQPESGPFQHGGSVSYARFSPDGRQVVTASRDCTARVWDVASGQPVGEPMRHELFVEDAGFSPDGARVVTASFDHSVRIWDARTGRALTAPLKHYSFVSHTSFSPNGRWVITACQDNTARIWDAHTGEVHGEPLRHRTEVRAARFSADSEWVVTGATDSSVRVWDVLSGQPVTEPLRHRAELARVSFSKDRRWVVSAAHDRTARIWEMPVAELPVPSWLPELAEAIAGQRRSTGGALEFVPTLEFFRLRTRLSATAEIGAWAGWAKWFFADRDTRTISANSACGLPQYVAQRLAESSEDSLSEVLRVAPDHALALARLALLLARQSTNQLSQQVVLAENYSRRAAALAPNDSEIATICAAVLKKLETSRRR